MITKLRAAARLVPFTALVLGACVSQSAYEKQGAELQQARAQAAAEQSQVAKMQQEQKWVVAGDVLFREGGYQLSANGKQALNQYVPQLQGLQNAKVVVYGYTDSLPVGAPLQRAGAPTTSLRISPRKASTPTSSRPRGSATRTRSPRTTRRKAGRRTAASRSYWKARAPETRSRPTIEVTQ
jgi:hypothetical protein